MVGTGWQSIRKGGLVCIVFGRTVTTISLTGTLDISVAVRLASVCYVHAYADLEIFVAILKEIPAKRQPRLIPTEAVML